MTHRYTLRVEADDPDALAEAVEEIVRLGFRVECDALAGQTRRRSRDEYLRQALALLTGRPWARCVGLEKEIATFEARIWPRWRDHDAPPDSCSALRRHLFHARRIGPLPSTARQLWNVAMKRSGAGNFKEKPL